MKLISIFSRIKTKCTDTMYSVVVKQSQTDRERGKQRKEERKRERTGCSLTLSDVVAAAAVIFPSGGNKVTLARVSR